MDRRHYGLEVTKHQLVLILKAGGTLGNWGIIKIIQSRKTFIMISD